MSQRYCVPKATGGHVRIVTPSQARHEHMSGQIASPADMRRRAQREMRRGAHIPTREAILHANQLFEMTPKYRCYFPSARRWRVCRLHCARAVHPLGKPSPRSFLFVWFAPLLSTGVMGMVPVLGPIAIRAAWLGDTPILNTPQRYVKCINATATVKLQRLIAKAQGRRYEGRSPLTGMASFYHEEDSVAEVMGGERPWIEEHELG